MPSGVIAHQAQQGILVVATGVLLGAGGTRSQVGGVWEADLAPQQQLLALGFLGSLCCSFTLRYPPLFWLSISGYSFVSPVGFLTCHMGS